MRIIIESWSKKFDKLVPEMRRATLRLGRLLGQNNAYVEIYLVGDGFMKKNVLAFPAPKGVPRPDIRGKKALGEIYLNPEYIENQRQGTRDKEQELLFMLVHGFLHLLGYDHKKKSDIIIMERRERELLSRL